MLASPTVDTSGVTHEVAMILTPTLRQAVRDKIARRNMRMLGEELTGTECGEHDLGEIEEKP
jgi:hypothetical protein